MGENQGARAVWGCLLALIIVVAAWVAIVGGIVAIIFATKA